MSFRIVFLAPFLAATPVSALSLMLDYTHDTATDNFFNSHPVAKASLEAARNDIQAAITTLLGAINNDVTTGTFGSTSATYNFNFGYTNPSTGAAQSITIATSPVDQVVIYVGMRELAGASLGQGGPGSTGLSVGGGGFPAEWPSATAAANALASAERLRGSGPTIGVLSGTIGLGGVDGTVTVPFGSSIGNLWFDNDTNNDTATDTLSQLEASWHFDHTIPVAPGKSDFYTVALHEMLHTLGFGGSVSWNANVTGSNWSGANVTALMGSGSGVVDPGGAHVAGGILTPRLSDGVLQEAVMSPTLTVGTRKTLTQLDLAFLRDINWQTIPEPSTATLGILALASLGRRRRRRA